MAGSKSLRSVGLSAQLGPTPVGRGRQILRSALHADPLPTALDLEKHSENPPGTSKTLLKSAVFPVKRLTVSHVKLSDAVMEPTTAYNSPVFPELTVSLGSAHCGELRDFG